MSKVFIFTHPAGEHLCGKINEKDKEKKDIVSAVKWNEYIKDFAETIKNGEQIMAWNTASEHRRKFIECKCDVVDLPNKKCSTIENQRFWGEWEQPSKVSLMDKDDRDYMPKYRHIPLFGKLNEKNAITQRYELLQNTDPYVFGDSFYYCCCKQHAKTAEKKLSSIEPGDIANVNIKM